MPIHVFRDDSARRLIVTVNGVMTTADTRALMSQQMADGTWGYGVLYDLRRMTTSPSVDDLDGLKGLVDTLNKEVRRGPVAVVGLSIPEQVARVDAYVERLKAAGVQIVRFDDLVKAEEWLIAQET